MKIRLWKVEVEFDDNLDLTTKTYVTYVTIATSDDDAIYRVRNWLLGLPESFGSIVSLRASKCEHEDVLEMS